MSLGSILKEARERKGLTVAQVAEQTRMIHQLVEDLERDDFHRITAAIYGRGFIKLFAECVGEEPGPLVQEFNEIYSGARRPGVKTRPVQTVDEETVEAEPEDRNAPPPRPKVRAVTLADEDVDTGAQGGRDEARPSPVAESGRDEARPSPVVDVVRDEARPSPVVEEVRDEAQSSPETSKDTSDASLLGELFDFRRRHAQTADSPTAKGDAPASTLSEETRRNIPIIQETPTWDDAPLEDGESLLDRVLQRLRNINIKVAAAVLGGILLLAVLVFGIALRRHSPSENPDAEMAATKPAPEAQPVAAPAVAEGDTVYTANLIPPPDSYVE